MTGLRALPRSFNQHVLLDAMTDWRECSTVESLSFLASTEEERRLLGQVLRLCASTLTWLEFGCTGAPSVVEAGVITPLAASTSMETFMCVIWWMTHVAVYTLSQS